jgi:hypothetical protein
VSNLNNPIDYSPLTGFKIYTYDT